MKQKFLTVVSFLWLSFSFPLITLAQLNPPNTDDGGGGSQLTNFLKPAYQSVPCLIKAILEVIVNIGSMVLVVFIVYTGLKFVMARGNASQLEEAKKALFYTLIGAAIVLGAFVISEAVEQTVSQLGTLPDGSPASCGAAPAQN